MNTKSFIHGRKEEENKKMKFKRVVLIVMDSAGIGEAPDSHLYKDEGSNTWKHASFAVKDFKVPTVEKLGVGLLTEVNNCKSDIKPVGLVGKLMEISAGKDTLTGHWEMMGIKTKVPFPSFTETGFPEALIKALEKETGRKVIGNIAASGTEIIKDLGMEHIKTGAIIVYTSADSVLQIAAHEDVVKLPELYKICEIARRLTNEKPEWKVGRIIARPFVGTDPANFKRTPNRHDYALVPERNVLNELKDKGLDVIAVGKINDIFNGSGITETTRTVSNHDGMVKTLDIVKRNDWEGLCFVNLVDFDSQFGHRRDAVGYARAIEGFDRDLKPIIDSMKEDDYLMITADHGNDPTFPGSDHTREYIPLISYSKHKDFKPGNFGICESFASIGQVLANNFGVKKPLYGKDFINGKSSS